MKGSERSALSWWRPFHWALIVVVTVGGFALAALLALIGWLYSLPSVWDGPPADLGHRLLAVPCIAMAGVCASAGPLLARVLRGSSAMVIVGGIVVGLGVTAVAALAIALA